ncbi:MAG: hypothetical protein GC161_18325 [Planctomycetaceae bacterium]|nr:hypothetical protein [Planctomycetaceae bacterium]
MIYQPEAPSVLRLEVVGMAPPALNELLRMGGHVKGAASARKKLQKDLWTLTWVQNREPLRRLGQTAMKGPFAVGYRRRARGLLDIDNLAASCKLLFDGLVDNNVLRGDQPSVLARWAYIDQERVAAGAEGYVLELFPL